jgi:pimeloyl-ACP methyl ester carboxylesterase
MMKLILLPGMDGTGRLFEGLIAQFGTLFEIETLHYPTDRFLPYPELEQFVSAALPKSEPFVLLAESYSTPVAVMCAARGQSNLKGLILCAGFVSSPIRGWRRFVCTHLALLLISRTPPKFVIRSLLAGSTASPELVAEIRLVISCVRPTVLANRLRSILTCDARAELAKVQTPIFYLRAKQDRLVGPRSLEEIRRIRPQTCVEEIAGPHLLLQREAERSAMIIKGLIERIPVN